MTRQKFYIVDYGDILYSDIYTKLSDAEKEKQRLTKEGYEVKIKIGYKDE